MKRYMIPARFLVALCCLTSAFLLSINFGDRGVQFSLRSGKDAAAKSRKGGYDLSALRIFNRVLLQLKDNYVEPARIKPNRMVLKSLEEIQNTIPQVIISHDEITSGKVPDQITVTVNEKSKKFRIGDIQSLWEMSFKLKDILGFIQQNLGNDPDIKYADIEYAAINGMLSTLDPHSTLLPPRNYEDMQTQTGGKFGGLGIVISIRDGGLTVMTPIPGTPAARKGIKARDKIVRIGDQSTVNMSLREAVGMLRGVPGTSVTLWIKRKGWDEARKYDVERAIIKIHSVTSQPLADKVGYVRIKNFQANTFTDLKKHLGQLKGKMGGMKGLVLDLRDNPGGLLDQAVRISDLFLDEGSIVSTVGQGNKLRDKTMAHAGNTEPKYPIVVLVNPGSASASEIVSGALKNNGRAIVVGDTTFGKGSVQVLYEFPDKSALKLTIAQYLTPGDISIQGRGITPDLRAMPVTLKKGDSDMFVSQNVFREGDLATALTSKKVKKVKGKPQQLIQYYRAPSSKKDDDYAAPDKFKEDFETRLAQKLVVAARGSWRRDAMLKSTASVVTKMQAAEMKHITAALKKLGVDWAKGANPKNPQYKLELTTSAAKNTVKAGGTVTVTATLTNTGKTPMHRMRAITTSDNHLLNDREFLFGKVAPGKSRSWSIEVKLPKDALARQDLMRFELRDDLHALAKPDKHTLSLTTQEQARPHFGFNYEVVDASGDGILQADEEVKLRLFIKNNGKADSAETLVYLKNLSNGAIFLQRGRDKIKSIAAGKTKPIEFTFRAKKEPKDGKFNLEVDIYDATYREFTQRKLSIPYGASPKTLKTVQGTATIKRASAILHSGASAKSSGVAVASRSATLPVIGKTDGWLKVQLTGRTAWVSTDEADLSTSNTALKGIQREVFYQAPTVRVSPSSRMTGGKSIKLKLDIQDDSKLKDLYVFVYNRQHTTLNTRKVSYVKLKNERATLTLDVPLFSGMNRVSVSVRDRDGMTATESAFVYRK